MKNTTLFFLINMFSGMGYSLVSPLFPSLGKKDNLDEAILGWIISTYSIAATIFTPFIPSLIKKYSRIKLLCFSTFFEATCTISYGLLPFIHIYPLLIITIFLLRILHGCCSAIIATLVYSLTISLSNEDETQISLGNLEVGWCLGTSCGPLFASFFYKIGGYSLPFITLGLFLYISVFIAKNVDSEKLNVEDNSEGDPPFASFLFHPTILIIVIAFIICMINVTYYYPCLTNHLTNNYNYSVSTASLFFIIPVIPYITIIQFLDKITAKYGIYITFTCGLIFDTISPLFIYPCPPLPKSSITIFIGFIFIGFGGGPVFIPGLVALSKNIRKIDQNIDELTANDIASAINNLTIAIGDFCGPIIGGFFTSKYNFKNCCYYVFFIGLINLLLFVCYFYNNIKEDIIKILFENKKNNNEPEKNKLFDNEKGNKDKLINEEILDNQYLNKSVLNSNIQFLDKLKIESLSLRRNSFANKFKRKENLYKISLHSSLTN